MDHALYIGMSGALQTMRAQEAVANNLANASTTGFRAQFVDSYSKQVMGGGFSTRYNAQSADSGWDDTPGALQHTGRDLDIALRAGSWLAVQTADGGTAYTRAGDLQVDTLGQLRDSSGRAVLGDGGPITVPPYTSIQIAGDGTVSVVPQGSGPNAQTVVGRLQIVEGGQNELQRGVDGLMRPRNGVTLNPAAGTTVSSGVLESSNVNIADAMVNMIQLARQFEMQTKLMKTTEDNASSSSSLVKMS